MVLPRITIDKLILNDDSEVISNYIKKYGQITRKTAELLIGKEKTTTACILNKMIEENIIKKIGMGQVQNM